MIIDDFFMQAGSANLNNRSMGLDAECDLVIEAETKERVKKEISRFRNRLLAEHCGTSVAEIQNGLAAHNSTAATIESFRDNVRYLEILEPEVDDLVDGIVPDVEFIDPERPISLEKLVNQFAPGILEENEIEKSGKLSLSFNTIKVIAISLLVLGFYTAWRWTPLGEWLSAEALADLGSIAREAPFTPLIVIPGYIIAGLVLFPITVLIIASVLAFGPIPGFLYALSGSLASALATYILGRTLGRKTVRKMVGKRLNKLSRRLARKGMLTMITVRIVPVAPFTVINIVAGASHIKFRDYFWGTLLGMFPGILALAAAGEGLGGILFSKKPGNLIPAILLFAAAIAAILSIRHFLKRKEEKNPPKETGNDVQ